MPNTFPFTNCANLTWHSWTDRQGSAQRMGGWMDGPSSTWPDSLEQCFFGPFSLRKRCNVAQKCQLKMHVMFAKELSSLNPKSEHDYSCKPELPLSKRMVFFFVLFDKEQYELWAHQKAGQATCKSWNAYSLPVHSTWRVQALQVGAHWLQIDS